MKNHVMFLFVAMLISGAITSGTSQVRLGAKAGLNLATQNWNNYGGNVETQLLPSFMIGGVVEFDMNENWGFGAGLQYQGKGTQVTLFKTFTNYLQIPVQLQYRSNGYFVALGPYVSYAINGKYKENGGDTFDLSFGSSEDDDFGSTDFGMNLEAGYEFRTLRATASYSLGFANIIPADNKSLSEGSIHNSVITVALTVLFGEY